MSANCFSPLPGLRPGLHGGAYVPQTRSAIALKWKFLAPPYLLETTLNAGGLTGYRQRRHQAWARVLSPQMSLSPYRKTYWSKIRRRICEILKFWSFLQPKSLNNVYKLLQPLLWTPLEIPCPAQNRCAVPQMKTGAATYWKMSQTPQD